MTAAEGARVNVHIPSPLRSYTREISLVEAQGSTLGEVMDDLDRRFPGFRFRIIDEQDGIRPHIKIFIGQEEAPDLRVPLRPTDEVRIICALSGG